jgi:hypothetical protein
MLTTYSDNDHTIYYNEDGDIGFQWNQLRTENGIADTFWIKVPGEKPAEFLTSHEAYAYAKKKANGRRIMNVNDNVEITR